MDDFDVLWRAGVDVLMPEIFARQPTVWARRPWAVHVFGGVAIQFE
ncbi:MAG: hypothetical protein AB7S26_28635 [Sandaracinaceae bacterium]